MKTSLSALAVLALAASACPVSAQDIGVTIGGLGPEDISGEWVRIPTRSGANYVRLERSYRSANNAGAVIAQRSVGPSIPPMLLQIHFHCPARNFTVSASRDVLGDTTLSETSLMQMPWQNVSESGAYFAAILDWFCNDQPLTFDARFENFDAVATDMLAGSS